VQAEEDIAMLKEFSHIARQMLFLHGHLTRPVDWAENQKSEREVGGGRPVKRTPGARSRALRLAAACVACGVVTPTRFVSGQIR
jgi:hypothetical protein